MTSVSSAHAELKEEWHRADRDLDECGRILSKLKVALTGLTFIPSSLDDTTSAAELGVARDILEIGALYAIEKHDIASFERYMAQLRSYYQDYVARRMSVVLDDSPNRPHLIGLNLLNLLTQNRLAEFHLELELLAVAEIQNNAFLKCPVQFEQYLMTGAYNKIFAANVSSALPAENYKFFGDLLSSSIRDQAASCVEAAFDSLPLADADKMLFFDAATQKAERTAYVEQRGWTVDEARNSYLFPAEAKADLTIPAADVADTAVAYATELELIV